MDLVIIIGLSSNSVLYLYRTKDNAKQKEWNTFLVTPIPENMHFSQLFIVVAMASKASAFDARSLAMYRGPLTGPNTCIHLPQTGCTARKMGLFVTSQDRQTQVFAAAITIIMQDFCVPIKMHDFRDHCYQQNVPLLRLGITLLTI